MNNRLKKKYPVTGMTYTLEQILQMSLCDSPHLQIRNVGVVQTSHLTEDELLSIPDIKNTRWLYVRTTSELIPVFLYSIDNFNYNLYFDTEPYKDPYGLMEELYWVTPKGFPRKQE